MTKNKNLTLIALFLLLFFGCRKNDVIYQRPTWLAGKLYAQVLTKPELSTFAQLLKISGYDTIINVSGSFTVFAPTNDAFTAYFQANTKYKSLADMPKAEAVKLVKYHLVQDAWSKKQLESLDVFGWIDTLDVTNNQPKGYKRQTLLLEKNIKYGVRYSKYLRQPPSKLHRTDLIDTTMTSWHEVAYTDSRKFVPIFFKQYFDIYKLSTSDYSFYYNRPFDSPTDLYYSNAKIVSPEMFAENGFVYEVDRVVEPLENGMEILSDKTSPNSYSEYLNLVNQFATMDYDQTATNKQAGAAQGLKVDSLFDLTYPQLVFNINSEKTKAPVGSSGLPSDVTIRYHHGIVAPTNEAFDQLVNQYLIGGNNWGSLENAPENIKRIIANSSLSINAIYQTDLQKGFQNGETDLITVDPSTIVQKQYGSNCTFIGVNKPIIPRAFSSVTGPVYTRKGFSKVMFAIEKSGLLTALKRKDANYSFFVESDANTSIDSSFVYDSFRDAFSAITLYPAIKKTPLSVNDLRLLLLNQIAVDQPQGIARKEFIKNLAGNYLVFNNVTKEVKGTAQTVYGYRGVTPMVDIPRLISNNADNGSTYEVDNWFSFASNDLYTTISTSYPKFQSLLKKAGLTLDKLSKYSFISDNQNYTVFVPSDSVLNVTNTSAMTTKQLQDFVMLHFVQGTLIFTDGKAPEGYYETARVDESSTPYTTVYTKIHIIPGVDKITIPSKTGDPAVVVNETDKTNVNGTPKTNFLTARNLSTTGTEAYTNTVNNGVVHEINQVILKDIVDTK